MKWLLIATFNLQLFCSLTVYIWMQLNSLAPLFWWYFFVVYFICLVQFSNWIWWVVATVWLFSNFQKWKKSTCFSKWNILIWASASFWWRPVLVLQIFFCIAILERWQQLALKIWPAACMNRIGLNYQRSYRNVLSLWFKMVRKQFFFMALKSLFWI